MRAVFLGTQTDRSDPFIDQTGILPRTDVGRMVNSAREGIIVDASASPFQPSKQARPRVSHQLKLNRPARLLLHHHRTRPNLVTDH